MYYSKAVLVIIAFLSIYLIFLKYRALIYNYSYLGKGRFQEISEINYKVQRKTLPTNDFLINTPGCYIPNYAIDLDFKSPETSNETCGERAIFIKPLGGGKILFKVDKVRIEKYINKKQKFQCCYRFAKRSKTIGREDSHLAYSKCTPFKDGSKVKLLQEVITVSCVAKVNKKNEEVYEDAYIIIKNLHKNKGKHGSSKQLWNVLILGIDTMSRARVYNTMPQTIRYFQEHNWLDYKGYQKVAYKDNSNRMSAQIEMDCSSELQRYSEDHLWNMFKSSGYITAFSEDPLILPDTLHRLRYKNSLADHYIRPLFLAGENRVGNHVCTKKLTSINHILDYAHQFTNTYKYHNFFGMFWINSHRQIFRNIPSLVDDEIVDFLETLNETNILNNTFIYFLSASSLRFDTMKIQTQSYYEERLPMLFMWVPHEFIKSNMRLYENLKVNQNRLVTPYDLYHTLTDILPVSNNSTNNTFRSETCPKYQGLFKEQLPNRTCKDAGVDEISCICHNITEVNPKNIGVKLSLSLAVSYIINKAKTIKTIPCMQCHNFNLKTLLRTHSYRIDKDIYYVIAFQMAPGDLIYEVTVINNGKTFRVIHPTYSITSYNTRGNCVINPLDRAYCICEITKCN